MNKEMYDKLIAVINIMLIDLATDTLKDEVDYNFKLYNNDYSRNYDYCLYCKLILKGWKYADLKYLYSLRDLIFYDEKVGNFNEKDEEI